MLAAFDMRDKNIPLSAIGFKIVGRSVSVMECGIILREESERDSNSFERRDQKIFPLAD